jgi:hypothetical protein
MSTTQEADYCFVVVDAEGTPFRLDVRPYDANAKDHLQSVWKRLSAALQVHHKFCQRPAPAWTDWKPWDWCEEKKPGHEGRLKYVGWCGNIPVGFMNVWPDFSSIHQAGKKLLYLEHIAASPGSLTTELWNRRFQAVGAALFAYAILLSDLRGFEGRVGLHIADSEADGFYRRLQEKCENALFYPDQTAVAGPTPRGEHDKAKTYLETREPGARRWLEEYRRE